MKILIAGFIVLAGWAAISTHIWVCNVLGLCNERITNNIDNAAYRNIAAKDSLSKSFTQVKSVIPGNLLIYFEFDKSELKQDSLTERYFLASKSYLDDNSQAVLNIAGYTDSIGSDIYNQALGYRRAETMQSYFINKGLKSERISLASMGEKFPASGNKTAMGRANNRRAVITIKN
jgi:outer membrane protein OmpA-like peptidoglycan-associated protein